MMNNCEVNARKAIKHVVPPTQIRPSSRLIAVRIVEISYERQSLVGREVACQLEVAGTGESARPSGFHRQANVPWP